MMMINSNSSMKATRGVLAPLLLLLVVVSTVQGDANPACDCGEVQKLHDKCVQDYWDVEEKRRLLEVAETQANEKCQGQLEQLRGDGQAQLGELQAQLEAAQTEVEKIQGLARAEFDAFQAKEQALKLQAEEAQRKLQDSSQKQEKELTNLKNAKKTLEQDVKSKEDALGKAKKDAKEYRRQFKVTKQKLDEMIAAKTIITIDYDLLQQRLQEIKDIIMAHIHKGMDFMTEQLAFVLEKMMEFWDYLQTEIFPTIVQFFEKEAIPFVKTSWKQAKDAWENFYAPHRGPVNKQIKESKEAVSKAYKAHLEPHVKEYKLDQHAADAKAKAEMYMVLAHSELVNGIDAGTGVALNYVKLEEGPDFLIDGLTKLHADPEKVATYLEALVAAILTYYVLKFLFGPRKQPKKPKRTKKEWEAEQAKNKQKMKSPKNGQIHGKNGKKKV